MKKAFIPAPPQPSFHFSAAHSPAQQAGEAGTAFSSNSSQQSLPASFDAAFLRGVARTSWWVGVVFAFVVYSVTNSALAAYSFALGEALSILLLLSQQMFVQHLTSARVASTRGATEAEERGGELRFPAWILLPGKYLLLGALIWALLRYDLIHPFAFVMGVPLVQVVITAKAVGRLMLRNRTSIRQAYVEKGKRNAV
jgi:hypothetical protein